VGQFAGDASKTAQRIPPWPQGRLTQSRFLNTGGHKCQIIMNIICQIIRSKLPFPAGKDSSLLHPGEWTA
jgi:hypothetical protein